MSTVEKRDWKKLVSEAGDSAMFLQEDLIEAAKAWHNERAELQKLLDAAAKKEIVLNMKLQQVFLDFRNKTEAAGRTDIWIKDIGFDEQALKDGEFIVNIDTPRPRSM